MGALFVEAEAVGDRGRLTATGDPKAGQLYRMGYPLWRVSLWASSARDRTPSLR
jgi:hypothetical protein